MQASQLLWSGSNPITWGSVSWNSVSWNSVSWNSVSWNSVSWNSVSWNSTNTNSDSGNTGCGAAFTGFTLINAQTNQDIQPLYENAIIDLDRIGSSYLTVRADTVGPVKSVKFDVNQGLYTKVENAVPYALYGDSNGNYSGTTFYPGVYETEISAYSNSNAEGTLLVNQDYQTIIVSSSYKPRLRSVYNGRCIDDNDDWGSPSEALKQTTCSSSDSSQKFRIKPVPGQKDVVNLVNVETGRCLDITGASTANGAAVIQWSCHGGTNQQFRLKGSIIAFST
ncbi:MAG: RICIN domain-containing protein [Caldilineaceae bacterium]